MSFMRILTSLSKRISSAGLNSSIPKRLNARRANPGTTGIVDTR